MKLTIFTPTYNRAPKLNRVFESLLAQESDDFEWLIVDDGSLDNTEDVVFGFQNQEHSFQIRYFKQNNGGKHRAYNRALELAEGEFFLCLDSDDWLAKDAIKCILKNCEELAENHFIVAYKKDEKNKQLSNEFPPIGNCTLWELSEKYHCSGEYTLIFPCALAKKFPFPTFNDERFITEAVVYDRIGMVADIQLLPHAITICEYQEDGLSNNLNHIMRQNPAGYCLYFMQRIDTASSLKDRAITTGKYHCFCIFAGEKRTAYTGKHRFFVSLTKPIGLVFAVYYKLFRGF